MTDRELLEQALKLVSKYHARETILVDWEKSVIEAIKARLAEDGDEPVAWLTRGKDMGSYLDVVHITRSTVVPSIPLYRRPQPKARLTDEEIEEIHREFPSRIDLFARAIEQKIWEKCK